MNDDIASYAFAALGHPNRIRVLRLLVRAGADGLTVSTLRERLGVPATTFAHHLKALADAKLVLQDKRGREVYSTANYPLIQNLASFLMEECCRDAGCTPQSTESTPATEKETP